MFLKEPTLNQLQRIQHKYVNNLSYSPAIPDKIIINNSARSFKWYDNADINFQAALYTFEEKIVVQIFEQNDNYKIIYLPYLDTNNFRIIFTKNYFVLNYESKFLANKLDISKDVDNKTFQKINKFIEIGILINE